MTFRKIYYDYLFISTSLLAVRRKFSEFLLPEKKKNDNKFIYYYAYYERDTRPT